MSVDKTGAQGEPLPDFRYEIVDTLHEGEHTTTHRVRELGGQRSLLLRLPNDEDDAASRAS